MPPVIRFADIARGGPYHAALAIVGHEPRERSFPHSHVDFYELMYVVAGRGVQRVAGMDLPMRPGDLVIARPRDQHQFLVSSPEQLRFINIAFPITTWRALSNLVDIEQVPLWDRSPIPPLVRIDAPEGEVAIEFHRALERFHSGPSAVDLIRLWTAVLPALTADNDGPAGGAGRPAWLVRACAAMNAEENLREGLPRLLALAAVSHGHLARSMREHYGCTPIEHVTELRLAHAARLLAITAEPVGRIAERCGFDSLSYFGRCFRRRYDVSPRDYRAAASRRVVPGRP
ncbi:AraC family transcriptional regulator [Micromonospora sp. LZ34]